MRHVEYKCPSGCEQPACWYCEGGLFACTACGGLEGTLTTDCPGGKQSWFTLEKVYAGELDFINGSWVRPIGLMQRLRGKTVLEVRKLIDQTVALPSMERHRVIRGW